MRIRGWSIEGFGRLANFSVVGLPDGLTVLHGANEAGKSTLLEFLRCILFGGRDRARRRRTRRSTGPATAAAC